MDHVEHICFDKDGTIIDVHIYWAHIIQKRAIRMLESQKIGLDHVASLSKAMGVDINKQRILPEGPVGYKPRNIVIKAAVDAFNMIGSAKITESAVAEIFVELDKQMQEADDYKICILPGVAEALQQLKARGIKISIYSSDRARNIEKVLNVLELNEIVDAFVGGDNVTHPKPDAEGFQLACKQTSSRLDQSIYVGDTLDDMLMAKQCASAGGWGVTTGLNTSEDLKTQAAYVFDNLSNLVEYLLNKGKK